MNLIVDSTDCLEANQIHKTTTKILILSILIYTLQKQTANKLLYANRVY